MKRINETFTEEEFEELSNAKKQTGLNWHDFIMTLAETKEEE
jgi:hypothetical protein